jgi:hypothetical protein
MNENHPDFESLRRLLALKQHETPPPGYFNNFSRQVMGRIRAGETEASVSLVERLLANATSLLKLLQPLETRPFFAGGFATALCMLLLFGAIIAQRPESASQAFLQPAAAQEIASYASATPPALAQPVNQMLIADNSTNPVINFQSSPAASFGQMPLSAQFATYSSQGN